MYEYIWIILSDVYLWEAAAPKALLLQSSFKISHMWALLFTLRDLRALPFKLGSNPEGTRNGELLLLLVDSSWHPGCKGTQNSALKKKTYFWKTAKPCSRLYVPLTAGVYFSFVFGDYWYMRLVKYKWSPFAPSCWTIAVLWPLLGRWLQLL